MCQKDTKNKTEMDDTSENNQDIVPERESCWKGLVRARICFSIYGFILFMFNYAVRGNLNIAIIAMVNHTAINNENEEHGSTSNHLVDGPHVWDEATQGIIMSSFFWGYLVTNFPGGYLADRIGSKHILGLGVLVAGLCCVLTPAVSNVDWKLFVAIRIIMGLALGPSFPSMHSMMSGWIPPLERSRVATMVYSGTALGLIAVTLITGPISEALGVNANFYIVGSLAITWALIWEILTYNYPEQHPRISQEELKYIKQSLGDSKNEYKIPVPWQQLLLSMPVWALVWAQIAGDWFLYTFQIYIPDYLSKYLNYDLTTSGIYSGTAYILIIFSGYMYSGIGDWILTKGFCSRNFERKFLNTWMQVGVAACILILALSSKSRSLAVAMLYVGCFFAGAGYGSNWINHIDLSPNFSGSIYGISNTLCTITGILSPIINGSILKEGNNAAQWRIVFMIVVVVLLTGAVVFLIFGSGNEQPWNNPKDKRNRTEERENQVELLSK